MSGETFSPDELAMDAWMYLLRNHIFRLVGNGFHVFGIILLLLNIWKNRSCAGISGKSQILMALVYVTRYLDLFLYYLSLYNTALKVFLLVTSGVIIYLMYVKFKETNDTSYDSFRIELLLIPCAVLSLVLNHDFYWIEILWAFSIYLEAVAILPQSSLMGMTGVAESFMRKYLWAMGAYRALYLPNWVFRYLMEGYYDYIAILGGIVQTCVYCYVLYRMPKKFPSKQPECPV